jgi:Flp pilus assembly protein TadG
MRRRRIGAADKRGGVAATELAVILPLFVFLFVLAVDFGRVFYAVFIVDSAARCGAVYGSANPSRALNTNGIEQKARAEAKDLDPLRLQVTSATGTDSAGNSCIDVTVTYPFRMVTSYLISTEFNVTSRIRMRVGPVLPTFN